MTKPTAYNQIEINDLLDDAIGNAVARRELAAISDDEATNIVGGLAEIKEVKFEVAGYKPIKPIEYCPPVKPPVKPPIVIRPPVKPPIKPICPPVVAGLMYYPKDLPLA
jgi:hypothetical protein